MVCPLHWSTAPVWAPLLSGCAGCAPRPGAATTEDKLSTTRKSFRRKDWPAAPMVGTFRRALAAAAGAAGGLVGVAALAAATGADTLSRALPQWCTRQAHLQTGGLTKKLPPAPVPDSAAPTAHKWPTPPSLAQRNHIDGFSKQGCARGPSPVHHSSPAARGLPGCRIWWPPRRAAASRAQSGPPASRAASRAAAWRAAGPRTRLPLRGRPRVPRRCSRTRRSGSVLRRQRLAAPACPAHSRALCGDIRTRRAPTQRAAPAFRCGGSSLQAVTLACRRTKEARPRLAARRAAERQAAVPPRQAGVSPPSGRLAAW
jgi:hypothetical protein